MPGKIRVLTLTYPKEFPVTVSKGVMKFQRKTVDKPKRWVTVCAVPGKKGATALRNHYGKVLGRKEGRDFRFVYQAK